MKYLYQSLLGNFFAVTFCIVIGVHAEQQIVVPDQYLFPGIPVDKDQRKSSHPYITGDTFRAMCDFIVDETKIPFDPQTVHRGDTIFVNPNYLQFFFNKVHPLIANPYILITHNSTFHAPGKFETYLDDPKLIAWFAKNAMIKHPKLHGIPLGMANAYWPWGDTAIVQEVRNQLPTIEKQHLLYINFDTKTDPGRDDLYAYFAQQSYSYVAGRKPFKEYLLDIASSKFAISPRGSSLDCHRTWELFLMNCIPIVLSSPLDALFKDLPIVIVKDWSEVNELFLKQQYEIIQRKQLNKAKMFFDYWLRKIAEIKQEAQMAVYTQNIGLPENFGLQFDAAMSNSDRYFHARILLNSDWQIAKKRYDQYVIYGLEYATRPRIPKRIHQIWIGSPLPAKYKLLQRTWRENHPDWEYILWTDADIEALNLTNKAAYDAAKNYGEKSDIARYEILYRFGGLYVDTDFECLQPFDILHHCFDFYTGTGFGPGFITYFGLMGSAPGHPILKDCIAHLNRNIQYNPDPIINILYTSGPYYFTKYVLAHMKADTAGRCVAFPVNYFYPWPNTLREQNSWQEVRSWVRPETFAIHHWYVSWNHGVSPGQARPQEIRTYAEY
jgi:inositol phosphorylceramide mannosyltransferase catalytic subunit